MALDLFQRTTAPSSHIEAKAEEDVFSLQYILDGTGQVGPAINICPVLSCLEVMVPPTYS